ncbi:MAG: NAD-dependent epimerase/dehydratase family protein [Chloroflexi bacterium]|nr:NAD-dependent epimerase/dehydratase family protein [Chloroflexota bacterium]
MPYRAGRFYEGKRVMVTGGLGFIGSNLAARLVDLGANVLLVDSMIDATGANRFNISGIEDRVSTRLVDVRDALAMGRLVEGQDVIFNLAGQVSHIDSMRDPFTDLDINCRAQLSLLEACRQSNPTVKVIFASTRQIYGRPDYLPVDERHLLHPTDVNGINKMAGEWYHILYNNVYGLRACSLRLTNTYGPRMLVKNSRQTAIGWFIRQVLDDEEVQLFGDGSQLRDFTYVDDVADAFLRAGASDVSNGQVFNIGGDEPISLRDLLDVMIEIAGCGSYRLVPFPEDKKAIDIGSVYADDNKIRRALGWEPSTSLREGLKRTIAFYREHRHEYWGEQESRR